MNPAEHSDAAGAQGSGLRIQQAILNSPGSFDDAWTTLLLCSRLGQRKGTANEPEPLRDAAWHTLRARLEQGGLPIGGLLGRSVVELQESFGWNIQFAAQVAALLTSGRRQELIAGEVARLDRQGIWVLCWLDHAYPERLRQRLGPSAPALLYGAGAREQIASSGVAVVGSRHLDAAGERFAKSTGRRCAKRGLTVFSGAAWGADRVAMLASTEAGGRAVGVVAGRLEQMLRDRAFGPLIEGGRLSLVTKVQPSAGFSVGNAMDRNKLIYCLAECAIVVTSSLRVGGTWAGAVENLRRQWTPLYVRTGPDVPDGNQELLDLGGLPLLPELVESTAWTSRATPDALLGAASQDPLAWTSRANPDSRR